MSVEFEIKYDYCSPEKCKDFWHTIQVIWKPWREPLWRLTEYEEVEYSPDGSKIIGGRKLTLEENMPEMEGLEAMLRLHKGADVLRAIKEEAERRILRGGAA